MSSQSGTTSIATSATGATTTTSSGETSIRVVVFSGKRDDWESWKEKFSVKAAIRGYEDILDGTETVPATHFTDGTKRNLTADEETIINNNKKGFGEFVLIMSIITIMVIMATITTITITKQMINVKICFVHTVTRKDTKLMSVERKSVKKMVNNQIW